MKKNYLPIGTVVKIKAEATKTDEDGRGKIGVGKKHCDYDTGIIVGGTYIQEGIVHYGYDYDDPTYWETKKQHFVYLVRPAFTMKPIKVFPEDLEENEGWRNYNSYAENTKHAIPFSGSEFQWNDQARSEQSEIMCTIPRDEKGRWVS